MLNKRKQYQDSQYLTHHRHHNHINNPKPSAQASISLPLFAHLSEAATVFSPTPLDVSFTIILLFFSYSYLSFICHYAMLDRWSLIAKAAWISTLIGITANWNRRLDSRFGVNVGAGF